MWACEGEEEEEGSRRGGEGEVARRGKQRGQNLFKGGITPRCTQFYYEGNVPLMLGTGQCP